jgi:hypothetical protein
VIGAPAQHIELPLVDHLVCERIQEFLLRVRRSGGEPLEQREGEANLATLSAGDGGLRCSSRALTDE